MLKNISKTLDSYLLKAYLSRDKLILIKNRKQMERILINVDYRDETDKFWQESYLKNAVIPIHEGQTEHEAIAEAMKETDGIEMSYKGMPQGNIFQDTKDGKTKIVGYHYRVKSEVWTGLKWEKALFTAWVSIRKVVEYPIQELELV